MQDAVHRSVRLSRCLPRCGCTVLPELRGDGSTGPSGTARKVPPPRVTGSLRPAPIALDAGSRGVGCHAQHVLQLVGRTCPGPTAMRRRPEHLRSIQDAVRQGELVDPGDRASRTRRCHRHPSALITDVRGSQDHAPLLFLHAGLARGCYRTVGSTRYADSSSVEGLRRDSGRSRQPHRAMPLYSVAAPLAIQVRLGNAGETTNSSRLDPRYTRSTA